MIIPDDEYDDTAIIPDDDYDNTWSSPMMIMTIEQEDMERQPVWQGEAFVAFVPLSLSAVSMPTNLFLFHPQLVLQYIPRAKSGKADSKEERSIFWEMRYFCYRK